MSGWQDFLRWLGIASAADVRNLGDRVGHLESLLDARFREMQSECDALGQRFAGHKQKTESELHELQAEIAQVLRILEKHRATEDNFDRRDRLNKMIRALKAKQTRAANVRSAIMKGADAAQALAANDV